MELIRIFHSYASPRKGSFRNHRHSAFEISLIVSGKGNYRVRDLNYGINSNDIFLYHTNEPHCITDISADVPMHILNIQFESRYFWSLTDERGMPDLLQTFLMRSERGENRLPNGTELNERIKRLILEADEEYREKRLCYEQVIKSRVFEILILLSRNEKNVPAAEYTGDKLKKISASMDYICENLSEPLSLAGIASYVGMARTYYCAAFKELNGISCFEYINIKRVELSMKKLRSSSENVLDIALSCGFNNTANFNKTFKKLTGLTPKEYRRQK